MSKRKERQAERRLESIFKGVLALFFLAALGLGGLHRFVPTLFALFAAAVAVAALGGIAYLLYRHFRTEPVNEPGLAEPPHLSSAAPPNPPPSLAWDRSRIEESLGEIDWYQFEKFCAALLRSEGYEVERKGGAQPDGGVDLVATKNRESLLVQCKHWRTWTVQEKVIRELLGSMTHFKVNRGALYTLNGWTQPAGAFAAEHQIVLADARALADRAVKQLPANRLEELLNRRDHHCPKCESPMVWRTGNFEPFWGCSTYPRCRATLKHSGAR
jgi:Holliday junction resolvase